jgi:rod shape-determining protein MreD
MSILLALVATYVTFVLDTSVTPLFSWTGVAPQIALATLVGIVWRSESRCGLSLAAAWGMIADGLSQGPLGIDLIVYVATAAFIQSVRSRAPDSLLLAGMTTGLVAFAVPIVDSSLRLAIDRESIDIESMCLAGAGPACATAVLAISLLVVLRSVRGRPTDASNDPIAHVSNRWRMLTE